MTMTRAEHLDWARRRALEALDYDGTSQAIMSMLSDLGKHPETQEHPAIMLTVQFMAAGHLNSPDKVRNHIEGIN